MSDDGGGLDAETLAYAHRMFDLARDGEAVALAAQIDAGLPVDLTNDKGDSLLILAAYYDRTATVAALLEQGADPSRVNDRGQTALAAATFRRSVRRPGAARRRRRPGRRWALGRRHRPVLRPPGHGRAAATYGSEREVGT